MNNSKGIILGLLAPITFGFLAFFSKPLINEGLPVSSILFYRFLLSAVIMSAYCAMKKVPLRITKKQFWLLGLMSALYVISGTGLVRAYLYIPSGVATTIHFMYPISVTAIMIYVFHERKSKTLFFSMILSVVGVALMCWNGEKSLDMRGIAWAVSTIFSYTIYLIVVNQTSVKHVQSLPMMFYIFILGSVVFALSTVIDGGIQTPTQSSQWEMILCMVILSTIIPNLALVKAIKNVGSVVAAILGCAEPLTAMIIGIMYFGEEFSLRTLVGFVMILVSVSLVVLSKNRENNPFNRLKKYFHWQKQKGNLNI
ncbi:MAG: EamA family transporter [Flavobacteriales bacterium]|nr:EamA family transporter [Flavobacteriales bacterium]